MAEWIVFYVLAVASVLGALAVVLPPFGRNPLHAAVALLATFSFMAGLFIMLSAHLVAVLQVLVYAGAVLILFTFVIMLLNLRREDLVGWKTSPWKVVGSVAAAVIVVKLAVVVASSVPGGAPVELAAPGMEGYGMVRAVGLELVTTYLFQFEVASILLLVAVVGAIAIARRREGGAR
jgi:NADH-quinone oxidoreductase subunit J